MSVRAALFDLDGTLVDSERQYGEGMVLPDCISIYRQSILSGARSEAEVLHRVRVTVIHEVAHHFGISDARLEALGWA